MSSVIANTWKLSWDAGRLLFINNGTSEQLKESFQAARDICATTDFAETMFHLAQLHLDKIIEQKQASANDDLIAMGNDIVQILSVM